MNGIAGGTHADNAHKSHTHTHARTPMQIHATYALLFLHTHARMFCKLWPGVYFNRHRYAAHANKLTSMHTHTRAQTHIPARAPLTSEFIRGHYRRAVLGVVHKNAHIQFIQFCGTREHAETTRTRYYSKWFLREATQINVLCPRYAVFALQTMSHYNDLRA